MTPPKFIDISGLAEAPTGDTCRSPPPAKAESRIRHWNWRTVKSAVGIGGMSCFRHHVWRKVAEPRRELAGTCADIIRPIPMTESRKTP
jgi:hypothetical protein